MCDLLLQAFGLSSTLTVGSLFCGSNLLDKFPYRSSFLPIIEASMEFSVFTKSPQGASQRKAHQVLTDRIKTAGEKTLVERGQQLVSELLERKQSLTLGHTPTVSVWGEFLEVLSHYDVSHIVYQCMSTWLWTLLSYEYWRFWAIIGILLNVSLCFHCRESVILCM